MSEDKAQTSLKNSLKKKQTKETTTKKRKSNRSEFDFILCRESADVWCTHEKTRADFLKKATPDGYFLSLMENVATTGSSKCMKRHNKLRLMHSFVRLVRVNVVKVVHG